MDDDVSNEDLEPERVKPTCSSKETIARPEIELTFGPQRSGIPHRGQYENDELPLHGNVEESDQENVSGSDDTEPEDEKQVEQIAETCNPDEQPSKRTSGVQMMKLNEKAGMQGLDLEKINEIIENSSKGSKFYNHKKNLQAKLDQRIAAMQARLNELTFEQLSKSETKVSKSVFDCCLCYMN